MIKVFINKVIYIVRKIHQYNFAYQINIYYVIWKRVRVITEFNC